MYFDKFITLEGGEGSGKTTVAKNIKSILENSGYEVIITREPGGDETSEQIRRVILNNHIHPKTEAHLFAAARIEHINNVILPNLEKNKIVICDRYVDSSVVYQGYTLGVENIEEINEYAYKNCMPKYTFFLDIDSGEALQRLEDNSRKKNRYDKKEKEFHQQISKGYKRLAALEKDRFITIDATKSSDLIAKEIIKILGI